MLLSNVVSSNVPPIGPSLPLPLPFGPGVPVLIPVLGREVPRKDQDVIEDQTTSSSTQTECSATNTESTSALLPCVRVHAQTIARVARVRSSATPLSRPASGVLTRAHPRTRMITLRSCQAGTFRSGGCCAVKYTGMRPDAEVAQVTNTELSEAQLG